MLYAMFGPTRPRKKVTFHSPVATEVDPEPRYQRSSSNNSDIASTCAVVGTDSELENNSPARSSTKGKGKEKMSTTDESSDAAPEWTRREDRIICVRKSEAKSWAEIGKELKRSRRECQQRHRALSSRARELGVTTAKLAKLYVEENEEKAKPKKNSKDKDESKSEKKTEKSKAKPKKAAEPESKPSKSKKKKRQETSESSSDSDSSSDPSSGDDDDNDDNDDNDINDPVAEYWAHRRYIYDTLFGRMYPDQKVLQPDRFYSESDCRVLAGLEARYRANKWLHMQADFCNATGRMVEAELLKAKFYEDQDGGPIDSA